MLELYQTEWCPSSSRVRQRLTELGLDFIARQVPVEKEERFQLLRRAGTTMIPMLVDGSRSIVGEDSITAYLGEHYDEPHGAQAHREKAAKARARALKEALECLQPVTR